jgi:hypothetical protein
MVALASQSLLWRNDRAAYYRAKDMLQPLNIWSCTTGWTKISLRPSGDD